MLHFRSLFDAHFRAAWVTIGSFDGVHLGHQAIARNLAAGAHHQGAPAVVLTFEPHPSIVLGKRTDPFYLTTAEQRAELLGDLGIDAVVTHPFTLDLAAKSPREFMEMVHRSLDLRHLWVGYDFALGRKRIGTVQVLSQIGEELGYEVHTTRPVTLDGEVVSSSLVREAVARGDVGQAARLLGRPHFLEGEIIRGQGRGRTIGIPTANLDIAPEVAYPKSGVYACRTVIDGITYGAMTNIGVRPTFEHQPVKPRVETFLLDFSGDLYGKTLRLEFVERIRDEQKFDGFEALVEQIHQDIETGRQILAGKR